LSGEERHVEVNRNVLMASNCFEGNMRAIQFIHYIASRNRGADDE
jgi:hypothetical protein